MPLEALFSIANLAAMAGWLLLAAAPGWRRTQQIAGLLLPLALAVAYIALLAAFWGRAEGGFGSLEGVATLFETPGLLLAGWVHYLAFDLFVGAWEVRDARARGVRHVFVLPCLLLTFLFGPAGFAAYLAVRRAAGRSRAQGASE